MLLLSWGPTLRAAVYQVFSIREVPSLVPERAAVFVDLDDTLICYPGHLGSEPWFIQARARLSQEKLDGLSGLLARELPVISVELETAAIIEDVRRRHQVLAITSRELTHPCVSDWQETGARQLQSIGIDLPLVFCGWGQKARVILDLAPLEIPVVLVDDRLSELERVEAVLGDRFIGIWYRAIEERRVHYDPVGAQIELKSLADKSDHGDVIDDAIGILGVS